MDRELRKARRLGGAELLQAKLRACELTPAHVEEAASLGHAAALELFPDATEGWDPVEEWTSGNGPGFVRRAAWLLGDETLPARVAADWAERVLPVFEAVSKGTGPREAVPAARAWAACSCEVGAEVASAAASRAGDAADDAAAAHAANAAAGAAATTVLADDAAAARAAYEAADAASSAADDAIQPASDACDAAHWLAAEAEPSRFRDAAPNAEELKDAANSAEAAYRDAREDARRAGDAAAAADAAAEDAKHAVYAAAHAAAAAAWAAAHAAAAEQEWQRLRLAAYVLGEVEGYSPPRR